MAIPPCRKKTMNKIPFIAVLLLCCPAMADLTLVQKTEQESSMMGAKMEMTTTIRTKGKKLRADTTIPMLGDRGDSTYIHDGERGEIAVLMHAAKKVQRISPSAWKEQREAMQRQAKAMQQVTGQPVQQPQLVATGRRDEIQGYAVEEYVAESAMQKMTYWVAPELKRLLPAMLEVQQATPQPLHLNFPDVASFAGFPIRIIIATELPAGPVVMQAKSTIEFIKIDESDLSDDLFLVPADYTSGTLP